MEVSIKSFTENVLSKGADIKALTYIVGDMNELGDSTEREHQKVGKLLKSLGATRVYFVGRYRQFYQSGFQGGAKTYQNTHELLKEWDQIQRDSAYFFIKGSRSLQLESIIDIK